MTKQIAWTVVLVALVIGLSPLILAQTAQLPPRLGPSGPTCLHGPSEAPADQLRREQALRFASAVNRAENNTPSLRPDLRLYRPLDQLRSLPPTPSGFQLQLNTDGATYNFSLTDTLDGCHFAIFSDQNGWIYQAVPTRGVAQIQPLELP
jgi:hypothetical protein